MHAHLHQDEDVLSGPQTAVFGAIENFGSFTEKRSKERKSDVGEQLRRNILEWNVSFLAQGIYDISGNCYKKELLLEARVMDGKTVYSAEFLQEVERQSLSTDLDYLVIQKAFSQISKNKDSQIFSINILPSSFARGDEFLEIVQVFEHLYNIDPHRVEFEILEKGDISDYPRFNKILEALAKRGYRIAIDDFLPDSSFARPTHHHRGDECIRNLEGIHSVKFDGEYVEYVFRNRKNPLVLDEFQKACLLIEKVQPEAKIVVEKIENEEMFSFFRERGVHLFQGYFFDKGSPFE